jgi:hypothetical protein
LLLAIAGALFVERSTETRFQQSRVEWFRKIIFGAELETAHDRIEFAQGRDHDDRNVAQLGVSLEAFEHFVAVHFRHHDVEEHEIDLGVAQMIERRLPARRDHDCVALPPQLAREHVAIRFNVVDH